MTARLLLSGALLAGIAYATSPAGTPSLSTADKALLDDLSHRSFEYFWEQASPTTGLVLDRAPSAGVEQNPSTPKPVASIAATGFGLAAICIAQDHNWVSHEAARQRVLVSLRFLAHDAPEKNGWFYHFLDPATGARAWNSEVSSIDTALLLAGVLTTRQCLQDDPDIVKLADEIYQRVDFPWMMGGSRSYFSHGWTPEREFLPYHWDTYSELLILYVLGIGSPTHPIPAATWDGWKMPLVPDGDSTYIGGGPLFIHQYSQAWLDLRNRGTDSTAPQGSSRTVDYYANSIRATRAQREYFIQRSAEFKGYSPEVWGVTASDSTHGYTDWGGNSNQLRIDGTVVPSAAAGSLMFTPDICIPAIRTMLSMYGKEIYGRYGFADAFNPSTGWVSPFVIGIDAGITLLSAENLLTGRVWRWFMANPAAENALDSVGLRRSSHQVVSSPGRGPSVTTQ